MATATTKVKNDKHNKPINTGNIKRTHRLIGTRHILSIAISPPSVGLIKFDNPSPT